MASALPHFTRTLSTSRRDIWNYARNTVTSSSGRKEPLEYTELGFLNELLHFPRKRDETESAFEVARQTAL